MQKEIRQAVEKLLERYPKLKADVAYKASEQGFTVGAMTLRNGKQVVGNGAISVTGLGTEEAVVKARMNIGKNGEILRYSGYNDCAVTPKIEDIEFASSMKKGIYEATAKNGNFSGGHVRVDIGKATEKSDIILDVPKSEIESVKEKFNSAISKLTGFTRDILSGKKFEY